MTPGIRPLVAGNWKMNGTSASLPELLAIGNGFLDGLDAEAEAFCERLRGLDGAIGRAGDQLVGCAQETRHAIRHHGCFAAPALAQTAMEVRASRTDFDRGGVTHQHDSLHVCLLFDARDNQR